MTDLDLWAAVVGALMPGLIAVVNRPSWPAWARAAVAVVVSVIAGAMTAYLGGDLHGISIVRAILLTLFSALGFYKLIWHPSGVAVAIEKATSPNTGGGRHELYDGESERQLYRS